VIVDVFDVRVVKMRIAWAPELCSKELLLEFVDRSRGDLVFARLLQLRLFDFSGFQNDFGFPD